MQERISIADQMEDEVTSMIGYVEIAVRKDKRTDILAKAQQHCRALMIPVLLARTPNQGPQSGR